MVYSKKNKFLVTSNPVPNPLRQFTISKKKIRCPLPSGFILHQTWQFLCFQLLTPTSAIRWIQSMASSFRLSIFSNNWCMSFSHASPSSTLLHWALSFRTSMRRNAFATLHRHSRAISITASNFSSTLSSISPLTNILLISSDHYTLENFNRFHRDYAISFGCFLFWFTCWNNWI